MSLPETLPPLPEIPSEEIRRQVFAHSTSLTFSGSAEDNPPQSNERLEFLGDSYLNYCVSHIIYREFPALTPGELTILRSSLVSNANLCIWARAYGLNNHLVLGYSMAHVGVSDGAEKLVADVFEAYIGGVLISNPRGKDLIEEFLEGLVRPELRRRRDLLVRSSRVDKRAAARLHEKGSMQGRAVNFEFEDSGRHGADDRWEAVCYWDRKEAGRAKGRNMQEAKHLVAAVVLEWLETEGYAE
jgi:dsRNA-specific ribonuclease